MQNAQLLCLMFIKLFKIINVGFLTPLGAPYHSTTKICMLTCGVILGFSSCRRLGGGKLFYLIIPRDISKILFVCSLQNGICNNLIVNCKHGIWKKNLLFRFITGDECSQVGSCTQNYPGTKFNELVTEAYSRRRGC